MILFPPFTIRFSTKINTIKHSNTEQNEIISLIMKYMESNDVKKITKEGDQIFFKYSSIPRFGKSANLVTVDNGIFNVFFKDYEVKVIYTFNMFKSILTSFVLLLLFSLVFYLIQKVFSETLIYIGLVIISISWIFQVVRERLVLNVIRRKIILFLGSR